MLYRALLRGDAEMLRAAARQAVRRYAGMEPGRPVGGTYYLYRTLRNLDLEGVLERLMDVAQQTEGGVDDFDLRLSRDTYELRIAELKHQIEAEIRRRLVADRGVEAMAKTLRKPLPSDIDFMHASREEMASLRKAIYPLTRKLAARLVRKRRHGRSGPLDFRSTVRHSLSYGGVPVEPKFRHPRPHKPDIMVVGRRVGVGGRIRPVHLAPRVRHLQPVLKGAVVRVHRRTGRGDPVLRGDRGHRRGGAPGEHRGGRGLGGRSLRLRPRPRGVLGQLRQRRRARAPRCCYSATPATTTTPPRAG